MVKIKGASGGVGLASVSLAKALGAKTVLASLTMPLKGDAVMAAGAGVTIDDLKDNLRASVMVATDRHGIDLVFELVGRECATSHCASWPMKAAGGCARFHVRHRPVGAEEPSSAEGHLGRGLDHQPLHQGRLAAVRRGTGCAVRTAAGRQDRPQHHEPPEVGGLHGRYRDAQGAQDRRKIRAVDGPEDISTSVRCAGLKL